MTLPHPPSQLKAQQVNTRPHEGRRTTTMASYDQVTSQERDILAPPVAFPHIPFQHTKLCSSPSVSPRLRNPFTRTPNLDLFLFILFVYLFIFCVCVREALERLALLHRFPLLFLSLAGVVLVNSSIDIALHDTFR